MTDLNLTHALAATGVLGKTLSGLELRLLELMVSGHPDRRATVIHRGEKFRCSPLSWQELMTGSQADEHAIAGAISSLAAAGACVAALRSEGLLRWAPGEREVRTLADTGIRMRDLSFVTV